ncbi:hypothetical protein [Stakelama tenebrarum]|uniref:Porin domain-containing protein n=1 Tax=Stakelama tenebrarum TaxID=2711215 RepID=A0A6G6Y0V4_9SPHN|nr:hypothetical protein [Sphingosinithalassobacter tenebrarum]QIG78552.1 hypothetical protein G5C33_01255 [Sphingosinithalassobacter tenebrarum]
MSRKRWMSGIGLGAAAAAGLAVSALHAEEKGFEAATAPSFVASAVDLDMFTPAAADPRLAQLVRSGSVGTRGMQFTPSETRGSNSVASRAAASIGDKLTGSPIKSTSVNVAPIEYDLARTVGWKHAAATGSVTQLELVSPTADAQPVDTGSSYVPSSRPSRVRAAAPSATPAGAAKLVDGVSDYSIDVGGSYSVTRNLDVRAGIRYEADGDRNRLPTSLTEDQQDRQAVYIGTAFRF